MGLGAPNPFTHEPYSSSRSIPKSRHADKLKTSQKTKVNHPGAPIFYLKYFKRFVWNFPCMGYIQGRVKLESATGGVQAI